MLSEEESWVHEITWVVDLGRMIVKDVMMGHEWVQLAEMCAHTSELLLVLPMGRRFASRWQMSWKLIVSICSL